MAKHTVLTIQFRAQTIDSENPIPAETAAEERVSLTIPSMESKYVVLPKVLEGVTDRVMTEHRNKVSAYLNKKAAEEARRREWRKAGLWAGNGEPEEENEGDEEDDETVTLTYDGESVTLGQDAVEAAERLHKLGAESSMDGDE